MIHLFVLVEPVDRSSRDPHQFDELLDQRLMLMDHGQVQRTESQEDRMSERVMDG